MPFYIATISQFLCLQLSRIVWLLLLVSAAFFTCQTSAQTLIYNVNGYTLKGVDGAVVKGKSATFSQFSGLSFANGVITGVYTKLPDLAKFERVIDGKGQTMLPGLIDAHGHVLWYGESLATIDLVGTSSVVQALDRVKARLKQGYIKGQWLKGRGWNQELWTDKQFPTANMLDTLISTNEAHQPPIVLERVDAHAYWVNSTVLKLAGITNDTASPPGGEIVKDAKGQPTGILIDNAMELVKAAMPSSTQTQTEIYIENALTELAKYGLTSVHDAGISPTIVKAYQSLSQQQRLPIRVYGMLDITDKNAHSLLKQGKIKTADGKFVVGSVKISADGALGSRGASLHQDYSDAPGQRGLLLHSEQQLSKYVEQAMLANFQVNTHAIGDRANTLVFDQYAAWLNVGDKAKLRHRVEHAQVIRTQELHRLQQLQMIASVQPTHATSDKNMAEDRLGKHRMKGAYAWHSLYQTGAVLAGGSDFPVESPNPFWGLHAAVTRQDKQNQPIGGWYPDELLSKQIALSLFTLNAAYAAHQETLIGSLEIGKQADFILVNDDYFAVPAQHIWQLKPAETWVAGERVYVNL